MSKKYIFGPVVSRRLGISLGVDVLRAKVCSLDCIYCEAGATSGLTCRRSEYVPLKAIQDELREVLDAKPELDYITYSGMGEPTLSTVLPELSHWIKENYPQYKLCLLTNGTLLNDPEVRSVLQYVDLAMPNFDASNDEELQIINRPAAGITVGSIAEGIRLAAAEYPGKLVLELFVVPGVNDSAASIERFANYIRSFAGLAAVQLNTLDRPGVVDWIKPADSSIMRKFIEAIEPVLPVEAVGRFRWRSTALRGKQPPEGVCSELMELLQRRAASVADIAAVLDLPEASAEQYAEELVRAGVICAEKIGDDMFYSAM